MSMETLKVVRGFIEALNSNEFERLRSLCSEACVYKGSPYVGFGINTDDSDRSHFMIKSLFPGSPAEGKLLPGDEILSVGEDGRKYEGFRELSKNPWGQGRPGTKAEFRIRRGGKELSLALERGKIRSFDVDISDIAESLKAFAREWPDHREEIEFIADGGEHVTVLSTVSGTNADLGRGALWSSCTIYTVREGKIAEFRGVDDSLGQLKQLGYEVVEPVKASGR